jgi:hypothetical protein
LNYVLIVKFGLLLVITIIGITGINSIFNVTNLLSANVNDLLHLPYFYLLTDLLLRVRASTKPIWVAGFVFLIVLGVEIIQPLWGREFSLLDIGSGVLGILIAYLLYAKVKLVLGIAITLYLIHVGAAMSLLLREYSLRPVINNFDHIIDQYRVEALGGVSEASPVRKVFKVGNHVLTMKLLSSTWTGIRLDQWLAINLAEYQTLSVQFNNQKPGEVLDLRLDQYDDKCILSSPELNIGIQQIYYDLTKCDGLDEVTRIALYFETDKSQDGFWFDEIKLIEVNK